VLPEPLDVVPGVVLDILAPELHHVLGRGRQRAAGQMLAHQQAHGDAERRFGFDGDGIEGGLAALQFQRRIHVPGDAFHPHRADGGDASLLDPLEHFLGGSALRRAAPVHVGIVVAQLEGESVAHAAHRVDLLGSGAEARQGHAHLVAAHDRRALAEGDLELVVFRDRADRCGGGPLERLERVLGVGHAALPLNFGGALTRSSG
jgi:hypothetical protein